MKEKKLKRRNIVLIISIVILVVCFALIAWSINKGYNKGIDDAVYNLVHMLSTDLSTNIFKVVTFLCSAEFMIILCVLLLIVIKNKGYPITLSIDIFGVAILNKITKYIFARERPVELMLVEETGYSFPSGHAMASLAFYGYVIYLVYKNIQNKWLRWSSISILSLVILLIGASRIYLGVHYFSDVFAGYILASIYLILFIRFVKIKTRREE